MCYQIEFVGGPCDGQKQKVPCIGGILPRPDVCSKPVGDDDAHYVRERTRDDGTILFVHVLDREEALEALRERTAESD